MHLNNWTIENSVIKTNSEVRFKSGHNFKLLIVNFAKKYDQRIHFWNGLQFSQSEQKEPNFRRMNSVEK